MINLVAEVWMSIPGYPGYEASQYGRVRHGSKVLKPSIHKARKNSTTSYLRVTLYDGMGSRKNVRVNRAVLLSFRGLPPTDKHVAAHIDGNSMNNWLLNLKWATHQENEDDKVIHGTRARGTKIKQAKLTMAKVALIRSKYAKGRSQIALAKEYGVDKSTINRIINRKHWSWV